jgi:hypothetical protein
MSRGAEVILTHGLVGEQDCGKTQRETCGTRETGGKGGELGIRICVLSLSRLSRTSRESHAASVHAEAGAMPMPNGRLP